MAVDACAGERSSGPSRLFDNTDSSRCIRILSLPSRPAPPSPPPSRLIRPPTREAILLGSSVDSAMKLSDLEDEYVGVAAAYPPLFALRFAAFERCERACLEITSSHYQDRVGPGFLRGCGPAEVQRRNYRRSPADWNWGNICARKRFGKRAVRDPKGPNSYKGDQTPYKPMRHIQSVRVAVITTILGTSLLLVSTPSLARSRRISSRRRAG